MALICYELTTSYVRESLIFTGNTLSARCCFAGSASHVNQLVCGVISALVVFKPLLLKITIVMVYIKDLPIPEKALANLQIDLAAAEVTASFTKYFALDFGEIVQPG